MECLLYINVPYGIVFAVVLLVLKLDLAHNSAT